jgi:hypothetical protein
MQKYQIAWQDAESGRIRQVLDEKEFEENAGNEAFHEWMGELTKEGYFTLPNCRLVLSREGSKLFRENWREEERNVKQRREGG